MNNANTLRAGVVDRGGLPFPLFCKPLWLANRPKTPTNGCGAPRPMANLWGVIMSGFVYFVRSGDDGPFKVGFATDAKRRLGRLQTGSPERLTLLHTEPGGYAEERRWHERLSEWHLRGEWFVGNWLLYRHLKRHGVAMRKCDEWKMRKAVRRG